MMSHGHSEPSFPEISAAARRDCLVLLAAAAIASAAAAALDLDAHSGAWAQARATWRIDEIALVLDVLLLGLAWFSVRRWREARREARLRGDLARALAREVAERRTGEERFRALVTASASSVWRAAPDGSGIEGMALGECGAAPPAGDWLGESVHPDDRARVAGLWQKAIASGRPGRIEYRVRDPDGRPRWFALDAVPIRGRDGAIEEWVGTLTGIHQEKLAQAALQEREERLRLATEAAELGTYSIDLGTGERHWSREMRPSSASPRMRRSNARPIAA
jgi:hypothetical protein